MIEAANGRAGSSAGMGKVHVVKSLARCLARIALATLNLTIRWQLQYTVYALNTYLIILYLLREAVPVLSRLTKLTTLLNCDAIRKDELCFRHKADEAKEETNVESGRGRPADRQGTKVSVEHRAREMSFGSCTDIYELGCLV